MSNSIIGEQIQKFRRAVGITQKELGECVGVSAQAVSQWESGGTPDVTLLPAIADRLGVTTDALFGREKVTGENMKEALARYIASLPELNRIREISSLMWEAMKSGCFEPDAPADNRSHEYHLYFSTEEGVMLGTVSDGVPFVSVFPEPHGGYDAIFAEDEKYISFFATLSKPHAFEMFKLLYQRPIKHCTVGVLAKLLEIDAAEAEALLSDFTELCLVRQLVLETQEGETYAYIVNDTGALVPFLYAARIMMGNYGGFHLSWNKRNTPLLCDAEHCK